MLMFNSPLIASAQDSSTPILVEGANALMLDIDVSDLWTRHSRFHTLVWAIFLYVGGNYV